MGRARDHNLVEARKRALAAEQQQQLAERARQKSEDSDRAAAARKKADDERERQGGLLLRKLVERSQVLAPRALGTDAGLALGPADQADTPVSRCAG